MDEDLSLSRFLQSGTNCLFLYNRVLPSPPFAINLKLIFFRLEILFLAGLTTRIFEPAPFWTFFSCWNLWSFWIGGLGLAQLFPLEGLPRYVNRHDLEEKLYWLIEWYIHLIWILNIYLKLIKCYQNNIKYQNTTFWGMVPFRITSFKNMS